MYYQGDYYQGDYYQGDPFFGALIGGAVSWLGKKLLGRGAKAAGKTAIARVGAGAATGLTVGTTAGAMLPSVLQGVGTLTRAVGQRIGGSGAPPMRTGTQFRTTATAKRVAPQNGCCPPGWHLNKSMSCDGYPPGSFCTRNRSMNPANPKALRRGLRRVAGFGKLAQRAKKDVNRAARALK